MVKKIVSNKLYRGLFSYDDVDKCVIDEYDDDSGSHLRHGHGSVGKQRTKGESREHRQEGGKKLVQEINISRDKKQFRFLIKYGGSCQKLYLRANLQDKLFRIMGNQLLQLKMGLD